MLHHFDCALTFIGLREKAEFASCAKATDRAETYEFLEDKLHCCESSRSGSFCSLSLVPSLIVATLVVGWCCVRSCVRRANVVVDSDGSHKRSVLSAVGGGGMVR